jgi:uncharacterized repeat protein (TIGR01451 family)
MIVHPSRWILAGALCAWLLFATTGGAALSTESLAPSPQQPHAVIPACDPIVTNTTWTAGNVYVANNCAVTIPTGVTLTIQPGATVKFLGNNAVLIVNGTLAAQGTSGAPITFSSVNDNAHGQAAPGSSGAPAAGNWYGIHFAPGSRGQISHAFIGYGTAWAAPPIVGWNKAHIYVDNAAITFANLELAYGGRPGIYLKGNGEDVQITDSVIRDHTGAVSYPGVTAIYQESINMQPTYSNLTFTGNTRDEVTIGDFRGDLAQDVTLGGANYGVLCGYSVCQLNVPNGRTLTIAPGTQIDFGASYGIGIASSGSLIAEGTQAQPVIFTSKRAEAGAANQYWMGIWAKQGSTLRLDRCDISYADNTNFGLGGLEINTDDAVVRNCAIHHNKQTGLYIYARDGATIHPTLSNVDVADNGRYGVYLQASSGSVTSVTWDGGRISDNGWSGVTAYTSNSVINPTLSNLTIAGNGGAGDYAGRYDGIYFDAHNVNPILENLTITGNVGTAIHWLCNGSITARSLTVTGNGANELTLPGCAVAGGRQWNLGDAGIPTRVTGNIEIAANGLLSLQPGTILRFDRRADNWSYGLYVPDQAALYALGTAAKPIRFVGTSAEMNWWNGIEARDRATIVLRHCEIAHGGKNTSNNLLASLVIRWGLSGSVPTADIQNCEIHHSGRKGVQFDFANFANTARPIFRYNNLHDNAEEAVVNSNAPPLDARENYWGDPTGPYHATQNPGGLGDNVGDNILFYPWLAAPGGGVAPGELLISTGAPNLVSPGETVDYAVQYLNQITITVQSSILMLQLPQAAYFLEGAGGAVYWPDRHQVIWKLGDLPPGAAGFVSARVRFQWGLPADYSDGSYTQFAGTNYNAAALDVAEYNAYQTSAPPVTQIVALSEAEFAAVRATSAELEDLYRMALAEGYQYLSAARITYAGGKEAVNAALRTADRQYGRILSLGEGRALASTVGGGVVAARDMTGGITSTLHTQTYEFWGSWAPVGAVAATSEGDHGGSPLRVGADCGEARCFANCMLKAKAWGAVARKTAAAISWVIPPLGAAWTTYEVYDEITTYLECKEDCQHVGTRDAHCCTAGDTRWSPTGLKQQCAQYSCDAVGTWKQTPDKIDKCGFGQRCVAGEGANGGCKDCEEDLIAAHFSPVALRAEACPAGGSNPRCSDLSLRIAKDPNDITGPAGDLLPGQTVTYTIRYENEGAGRAYGVYVVNRLPDVFNAGTLAFVNKAGTYLPATREIVWLVGELAPKGQAGSTGIITYTVALTGGLPSGTVVANQAVVTFPSVPEETPTNTWVNLVTPLVAIPQSLTTAYMTPLAITLSGREASGLPLTYEIVDPPHGGTLTGAAPNLTYTPGANFTGADAFTFRVSNGTSASRPAAVQIVVRPAGDTTPPQVLWTSPAADATDVVAPAAPVYTDTVGPAYAPAILIGMSEPLDATTVTSATVTLARAGGAAVAASVAFDGGTNQIVLVPRVALPEARYVATATTDIKDMAGNALAAAHIWRFTVGAPERRIYLPLVLK